MGKPITERQRIQLHQSCPQTRRAVLPLPESLAAEIPQRLFLCTLQEDSTQLQGETHTFVMLLPLRCMNIAVFRLGVHWIVRTKTCELQFSELWEAMDVAARYAKAEDHAESYRRGEDL